MGLFSDSTAFTQQRTDVDSIAAGDDQSGLIIHGEGDVTIADASGLPDTLTFLGDVLDDVTSTVGDAIKQVGASTAEIATASRSESSKSFDNLVTVAAVLVGGLGLAFLFKKAK